MAELDLAGAAAAAETMAGEQQNAVNHARIVIKREAEWVNFMV